MKKGFWFLLPVFLITGCKTSPEENKEFYAEGYVEVYPDSKGYGYVEIRSPDGFDMVPEIYINDTLLILFEWDGYEGKYENFLTVSPGDSVILKGEAGEEEFFSRICIPDEFSFTSPSSPCTLSPGDDLSLVWKKSMHAVIYQVDVYIFYTYGTGDTIMSLEIDTTYMVEDTFLFISGSRLFPVTMDTLYSGFGNVEIFSIGGAPVIPGMEENIEGGAHGYFWSMFVPSQGLEIVIE